MRRYQIVLAGTIAGIAGVLGFHTKSTHLTIPSAGATGTSGNTSSTASPSTTGTALSGAGSSGTTGTSSTAGNTSSSRSATSADQTFRYGDMAVKVTVQGTRITNVSMATLNEYDGRSAMIDQYAIPQLEQQVISAGSVNISGVSGATFTSQAFVNGVANALGKLGIK